MNTEKQVQIFGTSQRYQMKKAMRTISTQPVVRNILINQNTEDYSIKRQKDLLFNIQTNSFLMSQIRQKISSYKQQDIHKKRIDEDKFITYEKVIDMMKQNELTCFYCKDLLYLLYEFRREKKQWTLDRINNDLGHNEENIVLSCLECNLQKRRIRKEAFLFTKNLNIIQQTE